MATELELRQDEIADLISKALVDDDVVTALARRYLQDAVEELKQRISELTEQGHTLAEAKKIAIHTIVDGLKG